MKAFVVSKTCDESLKDAYPRIMGVFLDKTKAEECFKSEIDEMCEQLSSDRRHVLNTGTYAKICFDDWSYTCHISLDEVEMH